MYPNVHVHARYEVSAIKGRQSTHNDNDDAKMTHDRQFINCTSFVA